jgi:hypothetical protein
MIELNIDRAIRDFAKFIDISWAHVVTLIPQDSLISQTQFIDDWLQANWEMLVENRILEPNDYLEVYGFGADFQGSSSRVSSIKALPNCSVTIWRPEEPKNLDLLTDRLVHIENLEFRELTSFKDGYHAKEPPFDCALFEDIHQNEFLFSLSNISFILKKQSNLRPL